MRDEPVGWLSGSEQGAPGVVIGRIHLLVEWKYVVYSIEGRPSLTRNDWSADCRQRYGSMTNASGRSLLDFGLTTVSLYR
jgi:hypothetical protein